MKCELHKENASLCESHIIPKFVYTWMKKTGPGRFRQAGRINTPLQDGIRKKMLCKECEDKFSKYEKWFSEKVFRPYLKDNSYTITNEFKLKYFIISILWRILKLFKDDGNDYNFKQELDEAELEWRNFLLKSEQLNKFHNQHLILIDSSYWITEKSDIYFSRAVDIEIAESDKICFIYAKFSRFILIGEIIGFNEKSFQNTNTAIEKDFNSSNQVINEEGIIEFFRNRVKNIKNFSDLSEIQQKKNDKFYKNKLEKLADKEYFKILNKYK